MTRKFLSRCATLISLFCVGLIPCLAFSQAVGVVQFVAGGAEITRGGEKIAVMRATIINVGDVIRTEPMANVQISMVDSAFITLRPDSEMRIEKYDYNPMQPTLGDAVLELVTGMMRTFTGELANRNKDRFKMKTKIAILGIRGSGNVFANYPSTGTINHTLTGAHSLTSVDAQGIERTLVSFPGQTIQVLPGQAPRFIPTPNFIAQASSPPPKADAGGESSGSSGSGDGATSATTTAATSTTNASTAASQASLAAQLAANTTVTGTAVVVRLAFPVNDSNPGLGLEGALLQTGAAGTSSVTLNGSSQMTEVRGAAISNFLSGPAALPLNYSSSNGVAQRVQISGGTHRDGFRNADGSVILGRWEGATLNVTWDPNATPPGSPATETVPLNRQSLSYGIFRAHLPIS